MGHIDTSYKKFDPLNICSGCGTLERKSQLRRLPGGLWFCGRPGCAQERTALELDRANARQRPFLIRPVPNARPQVWNLPDSYEGDEGEILNFLSRAVTNRARYESVAGDPAPLSGETVSSFGWIGRYLYGMISENKRPQRMLATANTLFTSVATVLRSRQRGFGLIPGAAQATDPWWGGVLESGASTYVTADTANAGMVFLFAYRLTGTTSWLDCAKGAASYLRNVQAIGQKGTNYTSSNAAGTSRLYTGAVASEVSTYVGIDPADLFYSNSLFYPSDLSTLEFWKALSVETGDIQIGATGTAEDAFISAPSQLLSTSMADMRECWLTGIRDTNNETFTGLSATTPREAFNAYPATKLHFTAISGTGQWEFKDGDSSIGTLVSSQNFAIAIQSLYAYEGSSVQVSSVNSWLRGFESNDALEPSDDESMAELARSTAGEYDATWSLSTLLLVRDPESDYAAVAKNGSSLYDWGALGCLSALWGARFASSFIQARLAPLGRNQRFYDGSRSDGDHFDRISTRGMSGLGMQTAFGVTTSPGGSGLYPCALLLEQGTERGSDLQFHQTSIAVPDGELSRCNYWRFMSLDDNGARSFPYTSSFGSIPDGGVIVFYNGVVSTLEFAHMESPVDGSLPFYMLTQASSGLSSAYEIAFVRDDRLGAWRQILPQSPGPLVSTVNPIALVNDAIRAAQFAQCFRVNPNFPMSV